MRIGLAGAAAAGLLALAACGRGGDKQDGLTAEENAGLDNAAAMLDTTPDNLVPAGNAALDNGEGAMMESAAPEEDEADNAAAAENEQ